MINHETSMNNTLSILLNIQSTMTNKKEQPQEQLYITNKNEQPEEQDYSRKTFQSRNVNSTGRDTYESSQDIYEQAMNDLINDNTAGYKTSSNHGHTPIETSEQPGWFDRRTTVALPIHPGPGMPPPNYVLSVALCDHKTCGCRLTKLTFTAVYFWSQKFFQLVQEFQKEELKLGMFIDFPTCTLIQAMDADRNRNGSIRIEGQYITTKNKELFDVIMMCVLPKNKEQYVSLLKNLVTFTPLPPNYQIDPTKWLPIFRAFLLYNYSFKEVQELLSYDPLNDKKPQLLPGKEQLSLVDTYCEGCPQGIGYKMYHSMDKAQVKTYTCIGDFLLTIQKFSTKYLNDSQQAIDNKMQLGLNNIFNNSNITKNINNNPTRVNNFNTPQNTRVNNFSTPNNTNNRSNNTNTNHNQNTPQRSPASNYSNPYHKTNNNLFLMDDNNLSRDGNFNDRDNEYNDLREDSVASKNNRYDESTDENPHEFDYSDVHDHNNNSILDSTYKEDPEEALYRLGEETINSLDKPIDRERAAKMPCFVSFEKGSCPIGPPRCPYDHSPAAMSKEYEKRNNLLRHSPWNPHQSRPTNTPLQRPALSFNNQQYNNPKNTTPYQQRAIFNLNSGRFNVQNPSNNSASTSTPLEEPLTEDLSADLNQQFYQEN